MPPLNQACIIPSISSTCKITSLFSVFFFHTSQFFLCENFFVSHPQPFFCFVEALFFSSYFFLLSNIAAPSSLFNKVRHLLVPHLFFIHLSNRYPCNQQIYHAQLADIFFISIFHLNLLLIQSWSINILTFSLFGAFFGKPNTPYFLELSRTLWSTDCVTHNFKRALIYFFKEILWLLLQTFAVFSCKFSFFSASFCNLFLQIFTFKLQLW